MNERTSVSTDRRVRPYPFHWHSSAHRPIRWRLGIHRPLRPLASSPRVLARLCPSFHRVRRWHAPPNPSHSWPVRSDGPVVCCDRTSLWELWSSEPCTGPQRAGTNSRIGEGENNNNNNRTPRMRTSGSTTSLICSSSSPVSAERRESKSSMLKFSVAAIALFSLMMMPRKCNDIDAKYDTQNSEELQT